MSVSAGTQARVLGPRAYRVVRLLWWLLLPLAIAGPLLSAWREHVFIGQEVRGWAAAGVELYSFEPPTLSAFGPAAVGAGIRWEETVTAVGGRPVETVEAARLAAAETPAGRPLRFELIDETGRVRSVSLPRDPAQLDSYRRQVGVSYAVMFWLTYLIELAPSLIWLAAAVLLFRTRRREAAPLVLSLGALGAVTASLWDAAGDLYGPSAGLPGAVVLPAAYVAVTWALVGFPSGRLDRWWQKAGAAVVAVAFVLWGVAWILQTILPEGDVYLTDLLVSVAAYAALALSAAALADRWRRTPPGPERQQMKWAAGGLAGGVLFLSAGVFAQFGDYDHLDIAAEAWTYLIGAGLGCLGLALVMAGLLVALLRYRLYDAETLLGRSAAAGALTLGAVAIWAAAETVLKDLLAGLIGPDNGPALSAVFATVAALVVAPARKRLAAWMQSRMQPGVAALTRDAPERLRDLKDVASPAEIARWVVDDVAPAVRVTEAAVLAADGAVMASLRPEGSVEGDVDRWPIRLALPAGLERAPGGWLLLGRRPDGSPPSPDDRKAVQALTMPIGRALHGAAVRERKELEAARERAQLRSEIDALKHQLRPA